jgi:hypothetical protein
MGSSSSTYISALSNADLVNLATANDLPNSIIDGLKIGNFNGNLLFEAVQTFDRVAKNELLKNNNSNANNVSGDELGFKLDMNGQSLLWYLKWALQNKIPGYQQWMMKRAWSWSNT